MTSLKSVEFFWFSGLNSEIIWSSKSKLGYLNSENRRGLNSEQVQCINNINKQHDYSQINQHLIPFVDITIAQFLRPLRYRMAQGR